ncbi:hypothetical protein VMCG_03574 [Cytospora schulzeri]|uniref:Uncharacterized protein n=1 Tax=Cytospora schulzeri TaxID=448051 RepID=A0A423WWG9_9PEZI|nr:hypothetical protein VMCG_03574 [Valsa malicola]
MAPSVTDQCKAAVLQAVENAVEDDWDSKSDKFRAKYDRKRQEIQDRYHEKENKTILELRQAKESELSLLQREYERDVQAAKGNYAKGLMANITNELLKTIQDPSEGARTPSSCTLSVMGSSPGAFTDKFTIPAEAEDGQLDGIGSSASPPSTDQSSLPNINNICKYEVSNEASSAIRPRLSLHQRKANHMWPNSKRKRAAMVDSNDSSDNDGFVDSSSEGNTDDDIPAHQTGRRFNGYSHRYDISSPAARRASKMKHVGISGTAHATRQSQRWLVPSPRVQDSPPSGQQAVSAEERDEFIGGNVSKTENVSSTNPGYVEISLVAHGQRKVF